MSGPCPVNAPCLGERAVPPVLDDGMAVSGEKKREDFFQQPAGSIHWDAEQAEVLLVRGNRSRCECFGHLPRREVEALL